MGISKVPRETCQALTQKKLSSRAELYGPKKYRFRGIRWLVGFYVFFVLRAGFQYLSDFGHYFLFRFPDAGKKKQVCIRSEKPSESVIEDEGDVLVLVFACLVDGEYRR